MQKYPRFEGLLLLLCADRKVCFKALSKSKGNLTLRALVIY